MPTAAGIALLKGHSRQFRKECLELHRELKKQSENPAIKTILEKFPYVIVDCRGNLVGKKTAPNMARIPFGRRRIASSHAGKKNIHRWRKEYLPKVKRSL